MSHQITLELSDELYAAIERAAQRAAQTADAWLLAQLPALLPDTAEITPPDLDELWTAEEQAVFAAQAAVIEAEWQQYLAETAALRHRPPPTLEEAQTQVREILTAIGGTPLPEEQAIELAMSEEIAEWNLKLD